MRPHYPTFSRLFNMHPWDVVRLTADEFETYLTAAKKLVEG